MSKPFSRRRFVQTVAATGGIVLGFDSLTRAWVITSGAAQNTLDKLPQLDGALVYDEKTLAEFADDYGHVIRRTPRAVLNPASVQDIIEMVRYANRHNLKIAM